MLEITYKHKINKNIRLCNEVFVFLRVFRIEKCDFRVLT